MFTNICK